MFTTIITDCKGENEAGRQITRFNSLGLGPTNLIGIDSNFSDDATIEGSANLIDVLDAGQGKKGVIVLNVAPRGDKKEGGNGTHFAYFYYKNTLVISTIKGYCLSFVKEFEISKEVRLLEVSEVLDFAYREKIITKSLKDYIVISQFRSFDFVPRIARMLIDGVKIPFQPLILNSEFNIHSCVWCVDAFGNCKTTITNNSVNQLINKSNKKLKTNLGNFNFYERLKDVPYGETAIYIGSSGLGNNRFLEIATQGISGSATQKLNLNIGDCIEIC